MVKTTEHQTFLKRYRSILRLHSKTVPTWLYSQLFQALRYINIYFCIIVTAQYKTDCL